MDLARARKKAEALKRKAEKPVGPAKKSSKAQPPVETRPASNVEAPPQPLAPEAPPISTAPTSAPPEEEPPILDFDPAEHFVDFQAQRKATSAPVQPVAEPAPARAKKSASEATPTVIRDMRDDPTFTEILSPMPRAQEVLELLNQADTNPGFPNMDMPPPPPPVHEPLATMVRVEQEKAARTPTPVAHPEIGAFDSVWNDEEARLLGLVEEELFRRAYGEERVREEAGEKFIGFKLAGEYYAISILEVGEIIKLREITPVPHTPSFVAGILSLRGAIVPVVDLRRWLGLACPDLVRSARILILRDGTELIGFIVDHVLGVVKIPQESIEPPPASMHKIGAEFIQGVGRLSHRFYVILNTHRLSRLQEEESRWGAGA